MSLARAGEVGDRACDLWIVAVQLTTTVSGATLGLRATGDVSIRLNRMRRDWLWQIVHCAVCRDLAVGTRLLSRHARLQLFQPVERDHYLGAGCTLS